MNRLIFRRQSTLNVSQTWLQWDKHCAHARGNIKCILPEMGYLYAKKMFCLIKTCALISNSLFYSDELLTFSAAVNAQCRSNTVSIKQILRSHPWKNYRYFNSDGSFTCPKIYFAWLELALLNWKSPDTALKFWPSRRQSALDASQTWLQSTDNCAHIRTQIFNVLTEMDISYVQ